MRYFRLIHFQAADRSYCFAGAYPKEMGSRRDAPSFGREVGDKYPDDPMVVFYELDEADHGLKLGTHVPTSGGHLLVDGTCARRWSEGFDLGRHEILPFRLVNGKGRTHSEDYVILNPIGTVDCLDLGQSKYVADPDDEDDIMILNHCVLDGSRIPEGRDLLRLKQKPREYFFSQRLIDDIEAQGYTNFVFEEVEVV